jgi:hypothetical protein
MFEAYDMPLQQKDPGEAMTDQSANTAAWQPSYRGSPRYFPKHFRLVEGFQDALQSILIVSSFGFWALLLGFMPVMALCMLRGS